MKLYFTCAFLCLLTFRSLGQVAFSEPISRTDSILLQSFCSEFRQSIASKDKARLEKLFNFPFYCHQCIDYVHPNDSLGVTVKVSRKLFQDSVFQLFFDIPTLNNNKKLWTDTLWIHRVSDSGSKTNFIMFYVIVPPSKKWEGLQGSIYLEKRKGTYLITGLDTVP